MTFHKQRVQIDLIPSSKKEWTQKVFRKYAKMLSTKRFPVRNKFFNNLSKIKKFWTARTRILSQLKSNDLFISKYCRWWRFTTCRHSNPIWILHRADGDELHDNNDYRRLYFFSISPSLYPVFHSHYIIARWVVWNGDKVGFDIQFQYQL